MLVFLLVFKCGLNGKLGVLGIMEVDHEIVTFTTSSKVSALFGLILSQSVTALVKHSTLLFVLFFVEHPKKGSGL